jgi:hypothetical protein
VVLEVAGDAWEVARILAPHVARVRSWSVRLIPGSAGREQRLTGSTRVLAKLLAAGSLEGLWMPDARRRALRRRAQLVEPGTRAKNEVHAGQERGARSADSASRPKAQEVPAVWDLGELDATGGPTTPCASSATRRSSRSTPPEHHPITFVGDQPHISPALSALTRCGRTVPLGVDFRGCSPHG